MPRLSRMGLVFTSISALGLTSSFARAQTTTSTSTTTPTTSTTTGVATPCAPALTPPVISVSDQSAPERFLNFGTPQVQDLQQSTRPLAFNPLGVNFQDCVDDMTLEFRLTGCGFNGSALVQVWASTSSDCTQPADRGNGASSVCWLVSQGSIPNQLSGSLNYDIPVRNIVGPQALSPSPTTIIPEGISACSAQSTYLAVPININFVPITPGSGALAGQAFQYILGTDMVGPPAPGGVSIANGDTLFLVNWTPNTDTDTGGYDVVIDPVPGQEGDASAGSGAGTTQLICPAEAGTPNASVSDASEPGDASDTSEAGDGAIDESGVADGATMDATMSGAGVTDASGMISTDASGVTSTDAGTVFNDAGCYLINTAGSGMTTASSGTGSCNRLPSDERASRWPTGAPSPRRAPAPTTVDDAGNVIETDAATVESTVGGGIWNPPAGHVLNPDPTLGITSTGESVSTHTVTGLRNGFQYDVVVAAVDNYGNVGPPSTPPVCATPAPVNDFWKIYRGDGGGAGGGFCALEAVGAPVTSSVAFAGAGALVIAGLRRRRSKRR